MTTEEQTTDLAVAQNFASAESPLAIWLAPDYRDAAWAAAKRIANSTLCPAAYKGKPDDVMGGMELAVMLKVGVLVALQNVCMVHGNPTFKATFASTLANQRGPFERSIRYRVEGSGANLSVTAYATLADTGQDVSATASMVMARKEGWTKNPKYESMGEQMLHYRSAMFLIRRYCPEVLLGFSTTDEVEDVIAGGQEYGGAKSAKKPQATAVAPAQTSAVDALNQQLGAAQEEAEEATVTIIEPPQAAPAAGQPVPTEVKPNEQPPNTNEDEVAEGDPF